MDGPRIRVSPGQRKGYKMEKERVPQGDSSEAMTSRREFLHGMAGAGLVVATALGPAAGVAEPASPSPSTPRGRETFEAEVDMAGRYHIVSALVHKNEDAKHKFRLVLAWDSANNALVLDEAKAPKKDDPKYQIWEVWPSGAIRNKGYSDAKMNMDKGYLGYDERSHRLKLVDKADLKHWWTVKLGDHVLIMLEKDAQFVVRCEKLSENGTAKVPDSVIAGPLVIPDAGHSWIFLPTKDGTPSGGDPPDPVAKKGLILKSHVPDQCDGQWHNPACSGNPATWTGCTQSSGICKCTHSS